MEARSVDLPLPVVPVTRTSPRFFMAISRITLGNPSSGNEGIWVLMARMASDGVPRWREALILNRPTPLRPMAKSSSLVSSNTFFLLGPHDLGAHRFHVLERHGVHLRPVQRAVDAEGRRRAHSHMQIGSVVVEHRFQERVNVGHLSPACISSRGAPVMVSPRLPAPQPCPRFLRRRSGGDRCPVRW